MRYGIKKVFLLVVVFVFVGFSNIKAQAVYDTLYSYPDTTTFYNQTVTVVADIVGLAITFYPDSTWEWYQLEKLLFRIPQGVTSLAGFYFIISEGPLPEDSIISIKYFNSDTIPRYPVFAEIKIDPPIVINNNHFYISGPFIFALSISGVLNNPVPGQFAFWHSLNQWIESVPFYFNLKVVVKKNVTSVDDLALVPTEFQLHQNYPNPFNPVTTISWQAPVSGWQTIKIYNSLGEEVATLVNEYKPAGMHEVQFTNNNLPSGVYFYQLTAGEFVETKKMILMK